MKHAYSLTGILESIRIGKPRAVFDATNGYQAGACLNMLREAAQLIRAEEDKQKGNVT
jgi:hypothetical protein